VVCSHTGYELLQNNQSTMDDETTMPTEGEVMPEAMPEAAHTEGEAEAAPEEAA
jgi:hypothetical protein